MKSNDIIEIIKHFKFRSIHFEVETADRKYMQFKFASEALIDMNQFHGLTVAEFITDAMTSVKKEGE